MSDSERDQPVSISFSGSGYLATYQLGVVQGLLDNAPWVVLQAPRFYGASAGSLVAAAVVCGADIGRVREEILALTHGYVFGFPQFSRLDHILRRTLPKNAHRLANGRLHVSMTRIPDGNNIMVSEFHSEEDLIRALLCSCFVPVFCGMIPPCYKGVHYIDGGLTNIQPTQDSCPTLTVSPFAGDVDICPSDESTIFCNLVVNQLSVQATLPNFVRVANALFPRDRRALNKAFYNGYQDTLYYLQHSRSVRPYPGWVSELERVVVKPEEWVLPQLEFTEKEAEVEAEELESPLEVVTEERKQAKVDRPIGQDPLDTASRINPPGQALEVLICNTVAHLGMISILSVYLPQRALPYLLLPLSVIIWVTTTVINRVEPWVLYAYQTAYWLWQDTKHMLWFILSIIVSSVRRGVQHRMLTLFLVQTKHLGSTTGQLSVSPTFRRNPSISPSLHALFFTLEMRRRQRESKQNVP
ncbi:1-acylglycerol-3-phosphate O-acyltransferase Pnpla3 [Salminus brasiliensis]|uniref:1-acylglycerol-3-phosphate O-acyltransferase Pnpla3 n=1 Tax=Salminus brasiliensis TaxID=930266 RepID=UPI003B833F80